MNERIRELVLQANPASKKIYESDNWEYNCAAWCAQDLEKFAELIVEECCSVLEQTQTALDRHKWPTPSECGVYIKEHFEIRE